MTGAIREMTTEDYDRVLTLWQEAEGVGLSEADTPGGLANFLQRNPGLSFVAHDGEHLVGAVLCGHDGRRGYIHHVAVDPAYRHRGIGRALIERCLSALARAGIDKCHLFVFERNETGLAFWRATRWTERTELKMFSMHTQNYSPFITRGK